MYQSLNGSDPNRRVTVDELLSIIGMDIFNGIVEELEADKWVIKYKTMTLFKLLIYSLLSSERLSLRVMSEASAKTIFRAMVGGVACKMAHTTIRYRLMNLKIGFFEQAYERTRTKLSEHYNEGQQAKYHLKRYDSTMIATFSHLLSGMRVGNTSKNKTQVKFTTELSGVFEVRMTFFKDQAHLSEQTALAEVIEQATHSKKDLIVFDRGLSNRQTFVGFDQKNICFVTRLSDHPQFKWVKEHSSVQSIQDEHLEFLQDSIVHLYGKSNKLVEHPFRLIEMRRKSDQQIIFILTNLTLQKPQKDEQGDEMLYLTTQEVAQVYKQRWDIEVLFKFLKQELNLRHLVCHETNAIQTMIYSTLIVAMLLLVYKKINQIPSYKMAKIRFLSELSDGILLEIIENPELFPLFQAILRKSVHRV